MFNKKNSKEISSNINWQEAIEAGVDILIKNKSATKDLFNAILEITKKHGAYYVLEKGIALAHAPIGDYNLKPDVSLIYLQNNIQFNNENKFARIIITLSAIDPTSHISFIQEFGAIFGNDNLKSKLLKSKNLKEFLEIYNEGGGEKNDN